MTSPSVALPTPLQEYVHKSRYARWIDSKQRRENWDETVARYVDYFTSKFPGYPRQRIYDSIVSLKTMPSMRALMTAGPALERDPMAGFNCAFVAIDDVRAFDEILYVLMCGTGMGFSVERQFIAKLPIIGAKPVMDADGLMSIATIDELTPVSTVIQVRDSKGGWADAFRKLIQSLYAGKIPTWDMSKIRKAGEKLKVFGGRASGPQPLIDLFQFTVDTFKGAVGRKLNSVECHDLVCKIADIVVVGGVRRSALISLSNLSDDRMRGAKTGQWWIDNPQRGLANNSAAYTERPSAELFMKEWLSLVESKSGERGIFNRQAAIRKALEGGRRDATQLVGTNPCAEITLRSAGLCNLSEVVVRAGDTLEDLMDKIEVAVITGTYQSMLTNFRHVRAIWKNNQEEERLLGVSLTGIMDHEVLSITGLEAASWLQSLKRHAIEVNKVWADKLGINQSVAVTTVKPSGTVSQLVDSASGIHPRYSEFYIRTVRADKKDPLAQLMRSQGFPVEDCVTKPDTTDIFSFPVQGPAHAVFRNDRTAIEQLEHYLMVLDNFVEHNVSITVYVKDEEWLEVGAWVYKHFDKLAGVSFLPHSDHSYRQAPYTECDKATYEALLAKMPVMDWEALANFEKDDATVNTKELACSGGVCEIL
jgi:ribonucleoside-diphosphate reductase alpha chain